MSHFLIVHGACGNPRGNWFPWLENELKRLGHTVKVPSFPTPDGQLLESWLDIASASLVDHDPGDTVLIGHSVGAAFVLRLAERVPKPYKGIVAVCPFMRPLGLPTFDVLNASFIHPMPDWERVKRGARKIVCIAGDNDPYVPLGNAQEVAKATGSELIIVHDGGHLNEEAGYTAFPKILPTIHAF